MNKPAFVPPGQGGSHRVGKDGKVERVAFTRPLADPEHPRHAAKRKAGPAASAARPSSAAPRGQDDSRKET